MFFDKSKVMQTGDMFFQGMFPFMDVDNGGNIENWVRQLDAIIAGVPADIKIIPGHGPLSGVRAVSEEWSARSAGGATIPEGAPVVVVDTEGLTLLVEAVASPVTGDSSAQG